MKKVFIFVLFLGLFGLLMVNFFLFDFGKGYIVIKNGKLLIGVIGNIFYIFYGLEVIFINDFGIIY